MISDAFIRSVVSKISRLQISCAELKWYVHSGFQRYAMIINTGSRTDIPAFFSDWFYNRIRERYALVRNPYNPVSVTKYRLDPSVVDVISFCTKNPIPMLNRIHELDAFRTFFMVTITPYGTEIEPHVPEKKKVMKAFAALSRYAGRRSVIWRYDPVFIFGKYTVDFHKRTFAEMAGKLKPYTDQCVVSFLDLYEKTKRNFPEASAVPMSVQNELIDSFNMTAERLGMQIHLCLEDRSLVRSHVDAEGCFSKKVIENAIGKRLLVPTHSPARQGCSCLLGADIGEYNTCGHGCLYCYANYDQSAVLHNMSQHDPSSPLLIGHLTEHDIVHTAKQASWIDRQMSIFDIL